MNASQLTLVLVAVGLVVLSAIALIYLISRPSADRRTLGRVWTDIARRTSLRYMPGPSLEETRLRGVYRGREVVAAVKARLAYTRRDQTTHYYTLFEVYVRNPNRSFFRLNTKGAYRRTDQYLGQPVRPIQDSRIDARFDIKYIPHDLAERLFPASKTLRDRFLALRADRYVEFELEATAVRVEAEGIDYASAYVLKMFDLMCDFAEAFEQIK